MSLTATSRNPFSDENRDRGRRRLTVGRAVALLIGAALWLLAAHYLWSSTPLPAPAMPHLSAGRFFSTSFLARSASYERFLAIDGLLAALALIATLSVYAWRGERFMRESAAGPIGTGMLLGMLGLAIVWIVQLPFGLAALWWQHSHGVAKQGYVTWTLQSFFALGSTFLFVCLGLLIAMSLARALRRWWWLAAAPAFGGLALLSAFLAIFLMPAVHPLRDGKLLAEERALARREGVPGTKADVQEVSRQTTSPNAEAVGFGPTRRVVLWDTLLRDGFTDRQLKVVIAHELGHVSHQDTLRLVGWLTLFLLPVAGLIELATRRRGGLSRPEAVPIALLVLVALSLLISPLDNVVSRRIEASADWAALNATHDPSADRSLLRHLAVKSDSDPSPPTWSYVLYASHPSVMERIAIADAWERRQR